MPNILVVEDDIIFTITLEAMLEQMGYHTLAFANNYDDALTYLRSHHIDLIILDIHLAGKKNGLELAEKIQSTQIPIIFITSHDNSELYQRANHIALTTYLVKPFHAYTLDSNIKLLLQKSQNNQYIKLDGGVLSKVEDIIYLEADNTYTYIYTVSRKTALKKSLTQLMKMLPEHLFLKIHRRFAVQKRHILNLNLEKKILLLSNDIQLPISRRMGQKIRNDMEGLLF